MSANVAPSIVRTGLVLDLDAANSKSYVSGSTEWRDLATTNLSDSLFNTPAYNSSNLGSIQFDGIDDYAEVPNDPSLNSNSGSVSIWFNYSTGTGTFGPALIGKSDIVQSRNGYNIIIDPLPAIYTQIKPASGGTNTTYANIVTNAWYNYVFCYTSGQTCSTYLNSRLIATEVIPAFSITSLQPMRIADSIDFFWGIFGGRIANVMVYNRRLSDSEVLQNYNALKGRFGL